MLFGVPDLKKILTAAAVLMAFCVAFSSCGGSSSNTAHISGLTFRAFVLNPLFPLSPSGNPAINIVDATQDALLCEGATSTSTICTAAAVDHISLGGSTAPAPGFMVLFPNKRFTLVYSGTTVTLVDNAKEAVSGPSGGTGLISLPDVTQSIAVGADNLTGYAAVANASVGAPAPGAVEVLDFSSLSIVASLPVTGAQYVVSSHNGNRVLAMGSDPGTVTVISPSLIGTNQNPATPLQDPSFDHPVWAVFSSDDTTAYIFNAGPELGGTAAGITALDMTATTPLVLWSLPVPAATFGLLSGSTLYVAGTMPPSTPNGNTCAGSTTPTLATTCGQLSVIDVNLKTVTSSAVITDGYHNRMEMGANGQLFIGSRTCTNITAQTAGNSTTTPEIRGCLSIFNTANSNVVVPPQNGDVGGIAPITGRNVVYVCQGGALQIYDVTTDKLQTTQVTIVGRADDVKLVD